MNLEARLAQAFKNKSIQEDDDPTKENPGEETVLDDVPEEKVEYRDPLSDKIVAVMTAYQNANRWMDTIKEDLLINKGLINFSQYVHDLAHTMPVRFDRFGDILHTKNILVPYPSTAEYTGDLGDLDAVFSALFDILGAINNSLRAFIDETKDTENHSLALKTEELLVDIDSEYEPLYRMRQVYSASENLVRFDNWVARYIKE